MEADTTQLRERLQTTLGGTFTLERELEGGGMSHVFVARDARLGRRIVVKLLHPDLTAGLSLQRFEREVQLAARLQHPHVVPLLSAGDVDGIPFYTMPFVGGESLRERIRREGALPVGDAIRLIRELADALAYAHVEGVMHRDLKPENVLLSGGHAVIADFGVAKALASATHHGDGSGATATGTGVGLAVGTPAYMAPEQAAADPATDHRADLYALGLIAYEVLAGSHPFAARTPQAMLAAQLTETPQPLAVRRRDVPPALATLVTGLLAKRPDDRPRSAQDVVRALDSIASPASVASPMRLAVRPTRAHLGAAVLVGGLALGVAGAVLWARRPATTMSDSPSPPAGASLVERRVAVAPFENQTGDSALAPLGRLAGDWIVQGLTEAGFAEVVDPETIRSVWPTAKNAQALAVTTGARLVVSGAYYVEGDSLRFLARIGDAAENKLLRALEPVSTSAAAPQQVVALLRERVLGALGGLLDARTQTWAVTSALPPSLAAYQRWSTGLEHFYRSEFEGAAREFETATRLDSTFVLPLIWAAMAQTNLGAAATADSLLQVASRSRERLSPADRYFLDNKWAESRGDWAGALRAAREMARVAPGAVTSLAIIGWEGARVNRPVESVAALVRLDPESPWLRLYAPYFEELTLAYHLLGDYQAELTAAQRGRHMHPDRLTSFYNEARALAALGRVDDVERLLSEILDLPGEALNTPADVIRVLGAELRAHGHAATAEAAFTRVLRWYAELPSAERAKPATRARHAEALYTAGRWEEAQRIFDQLTTLPSGLPPGAVKQENYIGTLAAGAPDAVDRRGYLGALAARRGDRVAALAADSALGALQSAYLVGRHTYWRARIAALLGDGERAVALLREALKEGRTYPMLHAEADLTPLQHLLSFRELIRPKG